MLTTFQKEIVKECMEKRKCCMCVPMGSGKTIMSLHITKIIGDCMPALVVCSKTLVGNWISEINKFFGQSFKYDVFHADYMTNTNFKNYIPDMGIDLIITTPEVLSKIYTENRISSKFVSITLEDRGSVFPIGVKHYHTPINPFLKPSNAEITPSAFIYCMKWKCIIIDEIQQFSNIDSLKCCAISAICARYRIGTSGTPITEPKVERILGYYSLIGDSSFPNCKPDAEKYLKSSLFPGLNSTMVIRRHTDFVLPKCVEHIISHTLIREELTVYTSLKMVISNLIKLVNLNKDNIILVRSINAQLMAMIMYTRQFLVCPLMPYANIMLNGHKKNELSIQFINDVKSLDLSEWLSNPDASRSSRISSMIEVIHKHKHERCITFTCFRLNLNVLKHYIENDTKRPVFTIKSQDSIEKRRATLLSFEETLDGILLLTYDLGAEGLNLQKSHIVLLADVWWNDAKISQAIARVLRRGQQEQVVVYLFTSQTGIENGIYDKHIDKRNLIDSLMCGQMIGNVRKLKMKDIVNLIMTEENTSKLKEARFLATNEK